MDAAEKAELHTNHVPIVKDVCVYPMSAIPIVFPNYQHLVK